MTHLFPPGFTMVPGTKGPSVNMLAMWLKNMGYDPDREIIFDGDFTPDGAIERALRAYQLDWALPVTGQLDSETRAALEADLGISIDDLTVEMFSSQRVSAQ